MLIRVCLGLGGILVGSAIAGPAGGYAGWRAAGFLATGNPLHLIPGGSQVADGLDVAATFADTSPMADDAGGIFDGLNPGERKRW